MTSVTKSILIAVVLLICGLLIAAGAFILAGGSLSAFEVGFNTADLTEISQSYPASAEKIETALAVTDLRVFRTEGTEITLRYYDDPENPYYGGIRRRRAVLSPVGAEDEFLRHLLFKRPCVDGGTRHTENLFRLAGSFLLYR